MSLRVMGANSHLGENRGDNRHTGGWNNFTDGWFCGVVPGIRRLGPNAGRVIFLNILST